MSTARTQRPTVAEKGMRDGTSEAEGTHGSQAWPRRPANVQPQGEGWRGSTKVHVYMGVEHAELCIPRDSNAVQRSKRAEESIEGS